MKFLQPRALLTAAVLALGLTACSGGGATVQAPTSNHSQPIGNGAPGAIVLSASYKLAPAGGSYAFPPPQGDDGGVTPGVNRAAPRHEGTARRLRSVVELSKRRRNASDVNDDQRPIPNPHRLPIPIFGHNPRARVYDSLSAALDHNGNIRGGLVRSNPTGKRRVQPSSPWESGRDRPHAHVHPAAQ